MLAYPSRYEGFGLPPLEAMRAGYPVVATAVGALPEVLGDSALLVEPTSDAVADGLAALLDDEARRAELIARGSQRVERYSWDRCADGLSRVYETLTNAR